MLEEHLQKYFNFTSFKKGQKEVISKILDNQSVAAIFPTGAGKSLCYQLPAILLPHMTLVVSPLLSLMKDQIDFLLKNNIPAARLDNTLKREEYDEVLAKAKNGELKILMISVERFKNERFRSQLQKMAISLLVIDEAHCISEWGHNFRPEYLKLPIYKKQFGIKQLLLLTATATTQVIADMREKFDISQENIISTGFYRDNLFLKVSPTPEQDKQTQLLSRISEDSEASTIVYVTLQKSAETVADFLKSNKIKASAYHAGMDNEARESIQNDFMNGNLDCVVATIAFGMGIDKKDIRRIIHYDLPKSIESYSQEIGRSGRDDKPSFCEILANLDNVSVLENFIYGDTPEKQDILKLLNKIRNHKTNLLEIKLLSLSNELNIRMLPLKTLLVYLEMEGILSPKYTYFGEYDFKYITSQAEIVNKFEGERKEFIKEVFRSSPTARTIAKVDIDETIRNYPKADRLRIISALEYCSDKRWIELNARQSIDVYDIINRDFDADSVSAKMSLLFETKERNEIHRIAQMISFLENDSCLSKKLAEYFGEVINKDYCGHCSFCQSEQAHISQSTTLQHLETLNYKELTDGFIKSAGTDNYTVINTARFLCGISSPIFTKLKVKSLECFGSLEKYPFQKVKHWVADSFKTQNEEEE